MYVLLYFQMVNWSQLKALTEWLCDHFWHPYLRTVEKNQTDPENQGGASEISHELELGDFFI